jgi:hypothetical protein
LTNSVKYFYTPFELKVGRCTFDIGFKILLISVLWNNIKVGINNCIEIGEQFINNNKLALAAL